MGEKLEIISKIYLSLFSCVLWKGVAESTVNYCKKGDLVGVKGRLQSREYETEDERRKIVELVAEKVTFLSSYRTKEAD